MPQWLSEVFEKSSAFMPHGHCYFWLPGLLWLHVLSDMLIGIAYAGISLILVLLVRKIRIPFSPLVIAFGLFIGLCGLTHFMAVWTVWNPDYWAAGLVKGATAAASVATAIGLFYVRPQVEEVIHTARLSEERRIQLESTNAELNALYKKIKEMDELKTQFFANVSHELRTPLSLILGPTENLLGDSNLTQEQIRQLRSISRNGKSLLKQVNDLLDVAKLEEGQLRAEPSHVDVVPVLRRVASQFEMAAEQRELEYRVTTPDTLTADVDVGLLERVFVNLLANAFKFTPEHGQIHVELFEEGDTLGFTVADNGPGVKKEQQQAIFERFRQADGGATRAFGGTGLGLAIAKDFVDLHKGNITVDSTPGGGATFTVRLPRGRAAEASLTAVGASPHATAQVAIDSALNDLRPQPGGQTLDSNLDSPERPTVLVVEDTPGMSQLISSTLANYYNVATARDGREGLEIALALLPDLILTDIMMPRMGGDELVAELRGHKQFDTVPIILLSAKADDELRIHLLENGAQDYLTKPFVGQELLARVSNLIAVKRAGDALRAELASASSDLETLAQDLAIKHNQLQLAFDTAEVARDQAERASEVKSHFLAMVSHELRTPLSTIMMSAQLLGRQAESEASATLKPRFERMVRATQQLSTLVEGILEYTRVESGKIEPRLEKVDTVALAREVVDIAQLQVPTSEVKLSLAPPPENPPLFESDPRLLRVILNNLVSNALKFTQEGEVVLTLYRLQGGYRFVVKDSGIGIPAADLTRIFLPFEQVEPVQRKSIPGVGLGLALTKEIVEALGGTVEVQSQEGEGSTFSVCLPDAASISR